MPDAASFKAVSVIDSNRVFFAGGLNREGPQNTTFILDVKTGVGTVMHERSAIISFVYVLLCYRPSRIWRT